MAWYLDTSSHLRSSYQNAWREVISRPRRGHGCLISVCNTPTAIFHRYSLSLISHLSSLFTLHPSPFTLPSSLISHIPSLICCYVINNLVLNIHVKKIAPFARLIFVIKLWYTFRKKKQWFRKRWFLFRGGFYMRFFDRVEELKMLTEIERRSRSNAQFTVVTGRRRVGNW